MNLIKKGNKKYILVFAICLFILVYGVCNVMGVTDKIGKVLFDSNYLSSYFLENDNPALREISPTFINMLIQALSNSYFDELMAFGPVLFQIIIPLFSVISGIVFYRHFHSLYKMRAVKEKSYRKFIFKEITWNSLKLAASIFLAYFIFMIFVQLISDPTINEGEIARNFLLDIFGNGLILKHKFLYYFIEGSVRFFLVPFMYSYLAQASVLYFQNLKEVVATPIVYYYLLTVIGYGFAVVGNQISVYLSPGSLMSNGTFSNINSWLMLATNMIPLFLAIGLIFWKTKYVEV